MTGKAQTVMWLGILLVLTRLFTTGQWSTIWNTLSPPASTSGTANIPAGGAPQNGKCGPNQDLIGGKCIQRLGA